MEKDWDNGERDDHGERLRRTRAGMRIGQRKTDEKGTSWSKRRGTTQKDGT